MTTTILWGGDTMFMIDATYWPTIEDFLWLMWAEVAA